MVNQAVIENQESMLSLGLPERYLCRDDRFVFTDDDGFLKAEESWGLVGLPELVRHWCSLVLAPPWMGKTFVSKALAEALRTGTLETPGGGRFDHAWLTCFELARAHDELPPPWWDSWRRSDKIACWVIDAIDEGHHRQAGTGDLIAKILGELDKRERCRLRVLMFSRQRGLPQELADQLGRLDVHHTGDERLGFAQYQFGPLTREEAAQIVGGRESLEKVVQIIRQHDLQDEARYPKVIQHLAKLPLGAAVTSEGIWHDLLVELLTERNPNREKPPESELDDRFNAAAHIAAVLTLTGREEFVCEGHSPGGLHLNEIVPHPAEPGRPRRKAAREALDSDLFHQTATGYRFAQRNIQEKLCAFGLRRLRLSALKPMMADSEGRPFGMHVEALSFLGFVSEHEEVQKWVAENTSLLESDAPRLSLSSAKQAISRLVEVVKKTPHYLYEVNLRRLAAPKIGAELNRRLRKWTKLKPTVLRLLLDISAETGAKEVLPLASKIALDDDPPVAVRRSAVRVVEWCGSNDNVEKLESLATRPGRDEQRRNLAAAVARGLLDRGIWDVVKAARYAPPETPHTVDSCSMLLSEIKKKATTADARAVIRNLLRAPRGVVIRPSVDPLSLKDPKKELLVAMGSILLDQDRLSEPDLDVVAWAAVSVSYDDLPDGLGLKLVEKVSGQPDMRRKLFELGLMESQDRSGRGEDHMRGFSAWQHVLQYDDIDWLAECAQAMDPCPEFVWMHLLGLVYHRSEGKTGALAKKRRIGVLVREDAGEVFDRFMAGRREFARRERAHKQEQQRQREKHPRLSMGDIVKDILGAPEHELQQKLWKLSWICLVEPSLRPHNVDGQWEDLSDDLRDAVLRTCRKGLRECAPTPVADGSSYSALIGYEASAFIALLRYQDQSEWLTAELIEKWLPSVLRASANEEAWACGQCIKASMAATRKVALDWVDRELRQENPSAYVAAEFPAVLWERTFADEIAKKVRNPQTPGEARRGLLQRLAARSPEHALPIAKEWVSEQSWDDDGERPLLQTALNVLLDVSAETGWPNARKLYESHGKSVVLGLDALELPYGEESKLLAWPSDALSELGIILYKELPPTSGEDKSLSWGGTRPDDARWARDGVPSILLGRGSVAADALQRLADAVPTVRSWLSYHQAKQAANRILDTSEERAAFPLADVLLILAKGEYRLIRTAADLLTVLVEGLTERIAANAGEHLHMLYDRQHKRLRENALQAYVACRLKDLLPGKVLHRETQIRCRKRTDILVESPTLAGPITAVVIEVKWSDNGSTKDSLTKQLGEEYLLKEGKKHGIYLVGWCGGVRSWPRLKHRTPGGMQRALERQATRFSKRYEGTRIEVVVLDLPWSVPA